MTFQKGHKPIPRKSRFFCYTCSENIPVGKEIKGEAEVFCSEDCRKLCEDE